MARSFSASVRRVTLALFVLQLALLPMMAIASDADPEQDFCVGDSNNPNIVNGLVCKNPAEVKANDFKFSGLANPGNTNNPLGSNVTAAFAAEFPGINTLGISMARLDFAKGGLVPPHTHPRATEIIFVVEALNSQNPGTQIQAVALFNSKINEVVLEKAFGLGEKAVQHIEYTVEAANAVN
ncbi:unnamed protein product [Sphagnum troendelagicum]|uniref:Cupin type-1 domain-containing protein n=1 Tax=Sphagnum troendelagicum TaxID=128251 RepID=A0ABP0U874_9BRYO